MLKITGLWHFGLRNCYFVGRVPRLRTTEIRTTSLILFLGTFARPFVPVPLYTIHIYRRLLKVKQFAIPIGDNIRLGGHVSAHSPNIRTHATTQFYFSFIIVNSLERGQAIHSILSQPTAKRLPQPVVMEQCRQGHASFPTKRRTITFTHTHRKKILLGFYRGGRGEW